MQIGEVPLQLLVYPALSEFAPDLEYCVLKGYWVMVVNVLFSLLAVFHLTYLGSMFDADMDDQAIEEVRNALPWNFDFDYWWIKYICL